jgi:hypothetical protein
MISMRVEPGQPQSGKLTYRAAEYAFATEPRPATCGASFTINEIELMLADDELQRVAFVEGYCPHPGWRTSVLHPPVAFRGVLKGEAGTPITPGGAIAVHSNDDRWLVLVDRAAGWVRVGKGDPDEDREGVEFAPGAIGVLEGDCLRALWLRPERLPPP